MKALDNTHVLIVGGAGFVGSRLGRRLLSLSKNVRLHIIDNLLSAEKVNVPEDGRVVFTEGSIADDAVLAQVDDVYDYIFHLATYHGNQSSIHNPLADHENNALTTLKLFERIQPFQQIKKIVYSSAGCAIAPKTFDQAQASVEVDIVDLDMDSPYSISKIFGEFFSKYFFKQHRKPIVRARFQNVYGPGEILGAGQWRGTPATVWRNVTPTFIYRALKRMPLLLENQGCATRDFIYVDDIARGLIHCALYGTAGDVYNLASGQETTIADLASTINRMTKNPTPIEYLPKRWWDHSGKRFGCPKKSKEQLGFSSKIGIEEGLYQTIEWTKRHMDLIEATIEKHRDKLSC